MAEQRQNKNGSIVQYLAEERVIVTGTADKKTILDRMVDVLSGAPTVHDREELRRAIHRREALMSTGIGMGIAIPHVRIDSVDDLTVCAALVHDGVADYASLDDVPVRLIFMMAAHTDQHSHYLRALAGLSASLKSEAFRDRLIACDDGPAFFAALAGHGDV